MIALCQRSWCFCFLCLGCFYLWPGWSLAGKEQPAGWGHGGVWLCAGLPFVVLSMVSLRAGSHCIMILFQETRDSFHNCVSTKKKNMFLEKRHKLWFCMLEVLVSSTDFIFLSHRERVFQRRQSLCNVSSSLRRIMLKCCNYNEEKERTKLWLIVPCMFLFYPERITSLCVWRQWLHGYGDHSAFGLCLPSWLTNPTDLFCNSLFH